MSAPEQTETSEHHVTIDYGRDGSPTLSLTCSAPADAPCRAEWSCDCEEFVWGEVEDGKPAHYTFDSEDEPVTHVGAFVPDYCSLVDWFDNSEEMMRGAVTVSVRVKWNDGPEFILGGAE